MIENSNNSYSKCDSNSNQGRRPGVSNLINKYNQQTQKDTSKLTNQMINTSNKIPAVRTPPVALRQGMSTLQDRMQPTPQNVVKVSPIKPSNQVSQSYLPKPTINQVKVGPNVPNNVPSKVSATRTPAIALRQGTSTTIQNRVQPAPQNEVKGLIGRSSQSSQDELQKSTYTRMEPKLSNKTLPIPTQKPAFVQQSGLEASPTLPADIEARDNEGRTPLHWAALQGDVKAIELLLARGADIEAKDNEGRTPLHWVALNGDVKTINLLFAHGADIEARDNEGGTPLQHASKGKDEKTIELLLALRADINTKDNRGWTPLHWAALMGDAKTIVILFDHGVDTEVRDKDEWTPLHWAALNEDVKTMEILLDCGADIDARDSKGWTPLHKAALDGQKEIANFLLAKGANLQALTFIGKTPATVAYGKGFKDLGDKLRSEPFETSWQKQCVIAVRFGLESLTQVEGQSVQLGLIDPILAYQHLFDSFSKLFEDFSDINNALQRAVDQVFLNELPEKALASEKMIIIPTGWEEHSTTIVLAKDKNGEWLLFKCNRGDRDPTFKSGIYVYRVGRPDKLKEVLDQLILNKTKQENKDFFEKEMNTILELKQEEEFLSHSNQIHSNCNWASCKLALRALLYAQFKQEGVANPVEKSREVYKEWSSKDRDLGRQEARQLYDKKEMQKQLFSEILKKSIRRKVNS